MKTLSTLIILLGTLSATAQYGNLLKNAGHTDSTNGWTIEANGGNGVKFIPADGTIQTSHKMYKESQTIDLLKAKEGQLTSEYLDSEPIVLYSDYYRGYDDNGNQYEPDYYYLNITLYDKDMKVIDSFETGTLNVYNNNWQSSTGSFRNYGKGLRFIKFEHGGYDGTQWGGHYGTLLDNSFLSIGNHLKYTSGNIGSLIGWVVTEKQGDGWYIRDYDSISRFQTSHDLCEKRQLVDLLSLGYTYQELDKAPKIAGGEFFKEYGGGSPDDEYTQKVELLDIYFDVISTYTKTYACTSEWQDATFEFTNYGTGVRYIRYTHSGHEPGIGWKGHYGPVMDKSYLLVGEDRAQSTSIKDYNKFNNLTLYPNPAKETLNIQISDNSSVLGTICTITDIQGKVLGVMDLNMNQTELNVSYLEQGMYFVTLVNEANNIKQTSKFIKQ